MTVLESKYEIFFQKSHAILSSKFGVSLTKKMMINS